MAPSQSKPVSGTTSMSNPVANQDAMILPLREAEPKKVSKDKSSSFKLKADPGNAASAQYEVTVPHVNESNTLREILQAIHGLERIWTGLEMNLAPQMSQIVETILRGELVKAYTQAYKKKRTIAEAGRQVIINGLIQDEANLHHAGVLTAVPDVRKADIATGVPAIVEDTAWIHECLQDVVTLAAPHGALAKVKRFYKRSCRKPADMGIKQYALRLSHINGEEFKMLPPNFNNTQSFPDDELIEILTHSLPSSWKKEATKVGFDPLVGKTLTEVVNFFENIEAAESFNPVAKKNSDDKNSSKKKVKVAFQGNKNSQKVCELHGPGHSTEECRTLKTQKNSGNNKSWNRKADEAKQKSKKDLAAFIAKSIRKELNTFQKKRKSDDDEDEESVNQLDLNNFNLDMDDLSLGSDPSDGEISV